jgi:hypothetical protein
VPRRSFESHSLNGARFNHEASSFQRYISYSILWSYRSQRFICLSKEIWIQICLLPYELSHTDTAFCSPVAHGNVKQQTVRTQTEVLWQTVGHPHLTFRAKHIIHDPMFVFVLWAVLSEWQSSMYVCTLPLYTCAGAIFLQNVLNVQVKQTMYEISGYDWHKCFGAVRYDCIRRMGVKVISSTVRLYQKDGRSGHQ